MSRFLFWVGLASIVRAQTLQVVSPYQTSVTFLETGPLSISALGVGADGMTTYLEVGAETLAIEIFGTLTRTLNTAPISYTATFVEDASKFVIGTTDSGTFESCTFGADGQGTCVEQFVTAGKTSVLATLSGPVLPWYTLNAAASVVTSPTSAPTSSGLSTSQSPTGLAASQTGSSSASSPTTSALNSATTSSLRWTTWTAAVVLPVLLHVF
ncbi:hypothetical protein B0H13DRAFT_1992832 [Mycena leptocephala]|nr:hypothetical protein B0H13DRAFT_1992832 [Mycena leptocephala]